MESRIAAALRLRFSPVAVMWADRAPEGAMVFSPDKWGCVMWLLASAAKGRPAACDRRSFGCFGGGVGMGFGNQYENFPGGEDGFCHFLSCGNAVRPEGHAAADGVKDRLRGEAFDHFLHGEGYFKAPAQVRRFVASLPITEIPAETVVFRPLADVAGDAPGIRSVVFFVDPDQLSALVVLANYARGDNENVIIPYAAGCQTVGIIPFREGLSDRPRGVVGLTDISARRYVRKQLGGGLMTFTAPLRLYEEMEGNVVGSFLERSTWRSLSGGGGAG